VFEEVADIANDVLDTEGSIDLGVFPEIVLTVDKRRVTIGICASSP
jgi:hypothetical protein